MPTVNRGTRDYPYWVWVEPRVKDFDREKTRARQRRERERFRQLTPDQRAREMAATGLAYRYTGPPLFTHYGAHSEASHHVGKCSDYCRRGWAEHAHRVRKHLLRREARDGTPKKRRGRAGKSAGRASRRYGGRR